MVSPIFRKNRSVNETKIHLRIQSIANIAIVLTLAIGLLSFWYQVTQARAERTLELSGKLLEMPLSASQERIAFELSKLPLDALRDQSVSREFVAVLVPQMIATSDDPVRVNQDIVALVNHYDHLQSCIENRLCDGDLMLRQINPSAQRFGCLVMPYIKLERDRRLLTGLGDRFAQLIDYELNC